MSKSLKTIACLKILRGGVSLVIGISLVNAYSIFQASSLEDHSLLSKLAANDPFFQLLTNFLTTLTQEQIFSIGVLALCLGALRWTEAYGIWHNKHWGYYLAVFGGLLYIPFEINELLNNFSWVITALLIINVIVVTYLIFILKINKRKTLL